ncbi:DUF6461 domain-containing protein [Streptomyces sp. NPDC058394]|uniref:DUF6461 domain-containing protein n=1 Tax=unclassified Streptomyces TaxID=2593676 RepID=UPI00364C77E3
MDPRPGVHRRRGPDPGVPRNLSASTRTVTHSSNGGKPVHLFHRFEHSELRTAFEWPNNRTPATFDTPRRTGHQLHRTISSRIGTVAQAITLRLVPPSPSSGPISTIGKPPSARTKPATSPAMGSQGWVAPSGVDRYRSHHQYDRSPSPEASAATANAPGSRPSWTGDR